MAWLTALARAAARAPFCQTSKTRVRARLDIRTERLARRCGPISRWAAAAAPRASRAGLPLCGSGPDDVWQRTPRSHVPPGRAQRERNAVGLAGLTSAPFSGRCNVGRANYLSFLYFESSANFSSISPTAAELYTCSRGYRFSYLIRPLCHVFVKLPKRL